MQAEGTTGSANRCILGRCWLPRITSAHRGSQRRLTSMGGRPTRGGLWKRRSASWTSFGGLRSCLDRRARWGDLVAPGFVRMSVGCEDTTDLVADVLAAAQVAVPTGR